MGITIRAKNSSVDFYLSYSGFFRLRTLLAKNYNKKFGELYGKMYSSCTFNQDMNNLLSDEITFPEEDYPLLDFFFASIAVRCKKDYPLLDFFFASDCDSKCNYKVCKRIYELIKDVHDYDFQYAGFRHSESDIESFKRFLLECYKYHRNMVWS